MTHLAVLSSIEGYSRVILFRHYYLSSPWFHYQLCYKGDNWVINWVELLSHLFYMDNLKLYTNNGREIQSLLNSVNIFSSDIKMSFCTSKWTHLGIKPRKQYLSDGLTLPSGKMIRSLDVENGYKYLGVLEGCDI